jgi:hypothetical protein
MGRFLWDGLILAACLRFGSAGPTLDAADIPLIGIHVNRRGEPPIGRVVAAGLGCHYKLPFRCYSIAVMVSSRGQPARPRPAIAHNKLSEGGFMFRKSLILASFAVVFAGAASAATVKYTAALNAGSEVPPTKSTGSGEATATLDTATHELTYDVSFKGTSGDVTAAHIHGPAEAGKNAGVVLPLGNAPKSPIHGTAKLTPEQEQQLAAGLMYVNVHTKDNPGGELRGQLVQAK